MRVELPNGTIIDDIPEGTSKEVVMQKAIAAGLASESDFGIQPQQGLVINNREQRNSDNSVAEDMFSAFGAGAGQLVGGIGWLADSETISDIGKRTTEYWQDNYSPAQLASSQKRFIEDDWSLGDAFTDPRSIAGMVSQSAPMMAVGMGVGAATARGAAALGASKGLAATLAGVAGSAAEGTTIGAMVGEEVTQQVINAPQEMIESAPRYQELIDQGADSETARRILAREISVPAAWKTGVVGALIGYKFNKFLGDAVQGNLSKRITLEGAKGAALESATELAQTAVETGVSQHALNKGIGLPYDLPGAANEIIAGGIAGGAMGLATGVSGGITSKGKAGDLDSAEQEEDSIDENVSEEELREERMASFVDENGNLRTDSEVEQEPEPVLEPVQEDTTEPELQAEPELETQEELADSGDNGTGYFRVNVADIQVDPEQYQFRTKVNKDGVDSRLEGVDKWDDNRAGAVLVHRRKNGEMYVADGHHRLDLAKRLGQEQINVRFLNESDGFTVEDARAEAAMVNIANDKAEPIDIAKVIRDTGIQANELRKANNLPNSQIIRDGQALAALSDNVFGMVSSGQLSEKDGAAIGNSFQQDKQDVAADIFQKVKPQTEEQRQLLINEINAAGFAETQGEQGGLFGDDPQEISLMQDRLKVLDALKTMLRSDKKLFASLNRNADKASKVGNKIAKEANEGISQESQKALDIINRVATTPDLNDIVSKAAKRVFDGEKVSAVTKELKEELLGYDPRKTSNTSQGRTDSQSSEQDVGRGNERTTDQPVSEEDANRTDIEGQPSQDAGDLLSTYSEQDLQEKSKKEDQRKKQEAEETARAEEKEKADKQVDSFELTGSDRQADADARQTDIFDTASQQPIKPTGNRIGNTETYEFSDGSIQSRADDEITVKSKSTAPEQSSYQSGLRDATSFATRPLTPGEVAFITRHLGLDDVRKGPRGEILDRAKEANLVNDDDTLAVKNLTREQRKTISRAVTNLPAEQDYYAKKYAWIPEAFEQEKSEAPRETGLKLVVDNSKQDGNDLLDAFLSPKETNQTNTPAKATEAESGLDEQTKIDLAHLDTLIEKYLSVIEELKGRVYKDNEDKIELGDPDALGGEFMSGSKNISLGALNELKRKKSIRQIRNEIEGFEKLKKRILDGNLTLKEEREYQKKLGLTGRAWEYDPRSAYMEVSKNGELFKSERSAKSALGREDLKDRKLKPVKVDDGWALAPISNDGAPTQTKKQTKAPSTEGVSRSEPKKGKPLKEVTLTRKVKVEETGDIVTIEESAETKWRQMQKRGETLKALLDCVRS